MKIRKAKIEDVEQIIPIIIQLQKLHIVGRKDVFKNKEYKEVKKEVIEKILDKNSNVLIAIDEELKVCGVLICRVKIIENHINIKDTRILWIDEIVIKNEFKRQGIGKELIYKAKEIAKKENCSRLELNCWTFNKNAIEFYKKIGMSEQRINMELKVEE